MAFEIEKDVEMPSVSRKNTGMKYPFNKMEVGDSFSVPDEKTAISVRALATYFCKKPENEGKFFTTRKITPTTYRCWRKR
jgi:hypothetical protein